MGDGHQAVFQSETHDDRLDPALKTVQDSVAALNEK